MTSDSSATPCNIRHSLTLPHIIRDAQQGAGPCIITAVALDIYHSCNCASRYSTNTDTTSTNTLVLPNTLSLYYYYSCLEHLEANTLVCDTIVSQNSKL